MAFNSDEVNFLVYRYLEESGFHHSAYTFGFESSVLNAGIETTMVPRGALMSMLQKGLFFAESEICSLLTDGELDARFEKAIGTMSLLDCFSTPDSAKLRAFERRLRDESSRTCSPHAGTSASATANATPQPANSAGTAPSAGPAAASDPSGLMDASGPVNHSGAQKTASTASSSGEAPPSNGAQFAAKSLHHQQHQRERDFRAKQSAATSGGGATGPPPRGVYRTGPPEARVQFPPPITTASMSQQQQYHASLQFLQPQQLNHLHTQQQQELPVTSAGFAFTGGGGALDNGIAQAAQQYLKAGGQLQGKPSESVDNFLSPALHPQHQQQQRFLVTNGSYQAAGGVGVTAKRAGAADGPGATAILKTGSTGSVYDVNPYGK